MNATDFINRTIDIETTRLKELLDSIEGSMLPRRTWFTAEELDRASNDAKDLPYVNNMDLSRVVEVARTMAAISEADRIRRDFLAYSEGHMHKLCRAYTSAQVRYNALHVDKPKLQ